MFSAVQCAAALVSVVFIFAAFVDECFFCGFLAIDSGLNLMAALVVGDIEAGVEPKPDRKAGIGCSFSVPFMPAVLRSVCCSAKSCLNSASDSRSNPRSAPVFKLNIFLGGPFADA